MHQKVLSWGPHILSERCRSGRTGATGNRVGALRPLEGSNPSLSATSPRSFKRPEYRRHRPVANHGGHGRGPPARVTRPGPWTTAASPDNHPRITIPGSSGLYPTHGQQATFSHHRSPSGTNSSRNQGPSFHYSVTLHLPFWPPCTRNIETKQCRRRWQHPGKLPNTTPKTKPP